MVIAATPGMSVDSPVQIDPRSPLHFDRMQIFVRIALAIVLGWLGLQGGWLAGFAFVTLPLIAAIEVSILGGERYLREIAPTLWSAIAWLLRFHAYMCLIVDRFPSAESNDIEVQIACSGRPTVGTALARFVTSVPSVVAVIVLGCVASLLWPVAALFVLVQERVPQPILAYQRAVLRWQARLLAYHASLVAEYPPWLLDTGAPASTLLAGAGAR